MSRCVTHTPATWTPPLPRGTPREIRVCTGGKTRRVSFLSMLSNKICVEEMKHLHARIQIRQLGQPGGIVEVHALSEERGVDLLTKLLQLVRVQEKAEDGVRHCARRRVRAADDTSLDVRVDDLPRRLGLVFVFNVLSGLVKLSADCHGV